VIKQAELNNMTEIMAFINSHWKENHILATNEILFLYEFANGGLLNFIFSKSLNEIEGILGFLSYGGEFPSLFAVMWRALESKTNVLIGLRLLSHLRENFKYKSITALGVNSPVLTYYNHIGFKIGKLNQWYRLRKLQEYYLANVIDSVIPGCFSTEDLNFHKLEDLKSINYFFRMIEGDSVEAKFMSREFFIKRFYEHPIHEYLLYYVSHNATNKQLIVVMRVDKFNGNSALRIIYLLGDYDVFGSLGNWIDELLVKLDCEYADLYEKGINPNVLYHCGFRNVINSGNTIPNYFNPFEQRNITINYATTFEEIILFKGDGDQDRPS
jgi:hypothetical protein